MDYQVTVGIGKNESEKKYVISLLNFEAFGFLAQTFREIT